MQRVEVEAHEGQRRRRRDRDREAEAEHAATMAAKEALDRRQPGEAHFHPAGRRPQQRQQGRQQGDGEREGHGHAEAGNQAELGDADIVGRQEGEEARADRGGGHRQRQADAPAGGDQGLAEAGMEVPLGEETHAELDAEVDAEPDEQRDEGDRDQVEAAGHQQPEARPS